MIVCLLMIEVYGFTHSLRIFLECAALDAIAIEVKD